MNWNRSLTLAPILVLCFAITGATAESPASKATTAQTAIKPAPKKSPKQLKPQKFVGNISAMNAKTGAVVVKGTAAEKSFMAQDNAKDALERLAVGDRVRVQYSEKDGKLLATSVRRMKMPQIKSKSGTQTAKTKTAGAAKDPKEKVK
jgi:hypothetical protein